MLEFKDAKKCIKNANNIYIVGHINPDGDSIGAAFSLYLSLKKLGKNAHVIMPKCSDNFKFLPHIEDAVTYIKEDNIDLLIAVDASDISRLSISQEDIKKVNKILAIDHHKRNNVYGDINVIDEICPATCQLMYEFLTYMKIKIDDEIATYLYSGILTDTGSFNYATTTKRTLEIVSKLVGLGIDFPFICKKLNDTIKESKLYLIAKTIENMETYENGKIRYSYVDYETINNLGVEEEEAEGMTNYLRMVEGTEVAIYVRGKSDGSNKVSLRSGDKVDVSKIAMLFGGGGHRRASGYTMKESVKISKEKLLNEIKKSI
ncbi:MAG: bifunctional oligoribonuclease/PAP phosphatase NrnA [Clostridia bacterium]